MADVDAAVDVARADADVAAGAVDAAVVVASVVAFLRVAGRCWEAVIRRQAGCHERSTASQDFVPWLRGSAEASDYVAAKKTRRAMSWAPAAGHNYTGPGLPPH